MGVGLSPKNVLGSMYIDLQVICFQSIGLFSFFHEVLSLWWGGGGGFLMITVSHPTFFCVGVGLWLRWGWAVTI